MWDSRLLLDAAADAIAREERRIARAQEVHGIDARQETDLHPLLAAGLRRAGQAVLREQPYPAQTASRRGGLAQRAERDRCDLVVLAGGASRLADPAEAIADRRAADATLFRALPEPPPTGCPPQDAYWLEVKAVGQFAPVDGTPGPNRAYSGMVNRCAADLRKLGADPLIHAGGLLLVLFTADAATAEHDVGVLVHRCLDRGVGVRYPMLARVPIADRIGNACCTLALLERPV